MVLVLTHEIVSAFLFHYNSEKFLTCNSQNKIKESLKKLEQTTDVADCFLLIEDAIKVQTGKPIYCVVYLVDKDTGKLHDVKKNPLPNEGICWQTYRTKETKPLKLLDQNDPIAALVKQKCTFDAKYVFCQPIIDEDQVISILVVLTNAPEDFTPTTSLKAVSETIVGCYRRLCKCHTRSLEQNSTSNQPVQVQTSLLKEAIIQLCGELYDQDAADLQVKVIKFLEEHTKAECAFLLLVVPETHELFCQVIRGKVFDEEIRFPGHTSSFSIVLETKKSITLEDVPVDKRSGIEEFVGCKLQSLLCVPVSSRASDKLIALACLVNKKDKESFNCEDINVIKQCFQYTSTVLTSTLAFQNERKLKIQTQAMLQVARNLFTHLGEFTLLHGKGMDNFPYIKSGRFEVNVFGEIGFTRNHCRPFVPRRYSHQVNNHARLEMYHNIDAEIEKQEKIANQLTGLEGTEKTTPKKNQIRQPRIKSPERKKVRGNSPEKHYGQPYIKERRSLETDYKEFTPILESTRSNKPDIVLASEGATGQQRDCSLLESCNGGELKGLNLFGCDEIKDTNFLSSKLGDEETVEETVTTLNLQTLNCDSDYSDYTELPPFSPSYEKVVRHFFSPPHIEESEEAKDNSSFQTARSPVQSTMYSACEGYDTFQMNINELDEQNGNSSFFNSQNMDINELDDENSFFDTQEGNEVKVNASYSDSILTDSRHEDLSRDLQIPDNDFEQADARLSNSEPSFGNLNEPSILPSSMTESKPEHNEAFLRGSTGSIIDAGRDLPVKVDKAIITAVYDPSNTSLASQPKSIIIEDMDNHQKLTMSIQNKSSVLSSDNMSRMMPHTTQFSPCTEYIRSIVVPSTENVPIRTNDLTKLLREIMQEARNLTQAERCSVFLIDQETDELVAKVFDGILANHNEVQAEIRMPITQGIAGHVASTGNLLNIKDAYSHPIFYRGIDDSTGFRTRNILCFPIKNETDNVLGVAQLCNKMNGPYFTTFDEDVASAFAVYCCISISHSLMYQKVIAAQYRNSLANELMVYHMKSLMYQKLQISQHRNNLANELMIYHMQVALEEVQELSQSDIPPPSYWHQDFMKFHYPPREIPENDTALTCLTMFEDLGFISRWRIKRDTLARFMLMVRKGYRNPPYHNWMHAFAVAHFCYICIKNLKLFDYLEDIEIFALFVSCLCHDIDHRGTNNSYQVASKSVLAALYSSEGAVLERHHFAQTMCIINTEGCNIYENLASKDYQHVLDLMRDTILATDLAHHLKILKNIEAMAKVKYEKSNPRNRKLLICLIMTASDLSDQTKPWDSTKHIAALIYNEFFSQGDLEKSLGRTPPEMMDREKARIPDLQIGFLDHIALPVYRVLEELFPDAHPVHKCVKDNHRHWEKICALIKLRRGGSCEQMSYDQILALEEEANNLHEDEIKSVQQNGH